MQSHGNVDTDLYYLRMRGILPHRDVVLSLGIAPPDQVREQIRARRRPESLFRRDRLYVVRRHLRVVARERFCENEEGSIHIIDIFMRPRARERIAFLLLYSKKRKKKKEISYSCGDRFVFARHLRSIEEVAHPG